MRPAWLPQPQGLYDPAFEHDSCGMGFVADVTGKKSHGIIKMGQEVLENLVHRGAAGSDADTGDGAGLLFQIPDTFFRERCAEMGFDLPPSGEYAVGMFFLPPQAASLCIEIFERLAGEEGCRVLGWRDVPVNKKAVGRTARAVCPDIKQVFVANPGLEPDAFERRLYLLRRLLEKSVAGIGFAPDEFFYVPSLSSRLVGYKGMMLAHQLAEFYPDLGCEEVETALVLVHQRYSTNTVPSWPLAQPFRLLCHNGEINTLRGNINNMAARAQTLSSKLWGKDLERLLPVIQEAGSDSACCDNMLELLLLSGRSLAHAILMMIPSAWGPDYYMGDDLRGFYEYHSMFMEPWDGPAAITFTDGVQVGGILDCNGLRPARYTLTRDNLMVMASETGVLDIPAAEIKQRGRLRPGQMLLVDTERQRLLLNDEIKAGLCRRQHYRRWVAANRIRFRGFGGFGSVTHCPETLLTRQIVFGYTQEELDLIIEPMATEAHEPTGSMGNDAPLAVLSDRPQLLFNYFKQYFAQVTNPPIDPIRESVVMSLTTYLGREGNLLEETPGHARCLPLPSPVLTDEDLERLRHSRLEEFRSLTLEILFPAEYGAAGMAKVIHLLCQEAERCVEAGYAVLILSDRKVSAQRVPIPSLLALSAVAQHLIHKGIRSRVSLVVESGEPREVNHFALLASFGADAVNPYLALETIAQLHEDGWLPADISAEDAVENYIRAIEKGILKILSKMGISTLRSYVGAQVYEAAGLSQSFVDNYFPQTVSRFGGINTTHVAKESFIRHQQAYGERRGVSPRLESGGSHIYRNAGERHLWTPESIHYLRQACCRNDRELYRKFAAAINNQEQRHVTLRSLFDFDSEAVAAVPLAEVEPVDELVKRFATGAMSFGSLSREAHETLALAMNQIGGMSNSGEGGEDPARYEPRPDGGSASSAVKQVASGRFGVTAEYLANSRELQIKIAQGAKPGEGGHLPGHKVNAEIARVRHSTPGVSLTSPPPHHDIYSIEDLAQLIFDLKNANPEARISVKLVSEAGVGTIAAGVAKGHADMVLISGGDGGSGASPLSSIKHAGMPWELGLAETHQTLVLNDLRGRIRIQVDGQMRTGRDVAIAALLGAEEFGFGSAALVAMGCVMMRQCHLNTCPVGVATQDPRCRERFMGKPEHVVNYMRFVAAELRELMAALGFRTVAEMVGRCDCLKKRDGIDHWKAATLDFSAIFHRPRVPDGVARHKVQDQCHGIDKVLDHRLIADAQPVFSPESKVRGPGSTLDSGVGTLDSQEPGRQVDNDYPIRNSDRTTGAMLAFTIARRYGAAGLPDGAITCRFTGSAGQSFGSFAVPGMTMILEGDANDYVGKGLSGGRIILRPPRAATFAPAENVIAGNTLLYGATSGEAYFSGLVGERFAVRNSGARAVVEGVGDHGCEYMTGGVVAVLGPTGLNFAAGMSGGIAYVYDPQGDFDLRCNEGQVDLEPLTEMEDIATLRRLIESHRRYTESARAQWMLDNWETVLPLFVKVMPIEYRRALGQLAQMEMAARQTEEERVEHY